MKLKISQSPKGASQSQGKLQDSQQQYSLRKSLYIEERKGWGHRKDWEEEIFVQDMENTNSYPFSSWAQCPSALKAERPSSSPQFTEECVHCLLKTTLWKNNWRSYCQTSPAFFFSISPEDLITGPCQHTHSYVSIRKRVPSLLSLPSDSAALDEGTECRRKTSMCLSP